MQQYFGLIFLNIILTALPFLLVLSSAYLRISIVLSAFKQGIAASNIPFSTIIIFISLFMSILVMKPVIHEVYLNYQHEENIEKLALKFLSKPQQARDFTNKLENIIKPLKLFMITQIEKNKEIKLESFDFISTCLVKNAGRKNNIDPTSCGFFEVNLIFVFSELELAIKASLYILLPFLIIDLLVSNLLVVLNLNSLNPSVLTLPVKLFLILKSELLIKLLNIIYHSYS